MQRRWALVCMLTLALTLAFAGCGSNATDRPSAAEPIATSSPTVPASPTAQPTVTPSSQPCGDYVSKEAGVVRDGELLLLPAFTDPDTLLYQLPDGTPLAPLKLPAQDSTGHFASWPDSTLGTTSVYVAVCNGSATTAHLIQGARVKLTAFTAYSAHLSEWDYCAGSYTRPAGVTPNNCDRGTAPIDEGLQAVFTANALPGTVVTATQPAPPFEGFGPLPATLPAGSIMYLNVQLTAPTAPGTYTFAVSITADGTDAPFTAGTAMLLAPVAHVWNGQACTAASMLAQIPPATNLPTPYICPVG
jgi:hypothetical protein